MVKNIKQGNLIYGIRSYLVFIHLDILLLINYLKKLKTKINIINDIKSKFLTYHDVIFLNYLNKKVKVNGYAHITGGGYNNIERILDENLGVELNIPLYEPYVFILSYGY